MNTNKHGPIKAVKIPRPAREEMRGLLKKLREAAMNTPALDSSEEWTDLIVEIDAMLLRCKNGGRFKLTDVDHERIRNLAPEIYRRVEAKEPVLQIARDLKMNRTTVRKWYKVEKRKREQSRQS